jgi:hypothetical protein
MAPVKKEVVEFKEENKELEAKFHVEQAASAIRLPGDQFVGSFCVHVYKKTFANLPQYTFACQFIGHPEESIAIAAAQDLRDNMMKKYGHEVKAR